MPGGSYEDTRIFSFNVDKSVKERRAEGTHVIKNFPHNLGIYFTSAKPQEEEKAKKARKRWRKVERMAGT